MSSDSASDARTRFARDMRRIREHRDVSIDVIHEATRIARNLIEAFERGDLYDHPAFNRVYLRSFVRAYANTVDIDPDAALDALDRAINDDYANGLVVRYLDQEPLSESAQAFAREAASEDDADAQDASDPDETSASTPPTDTSDRPGVDDDMSRQRSRERDTTPDRDPSASSSSDIPRYKETDDVEADADDAGADEEALTQEERERPGTAASEEPPAPSPGDPSFDVDAPSEPVRSSSDDTARSSTGSSSGAPSEPVNVGTVGDSSDFQRRPRETDRPARSSNMPSLAVIGGGIATVVVFIALAVFLLSGGDEAAEPDPAAAPVADTSAAPAEPDTAAAQPERPPLANLTLGSELTLTVVPSEDVQGLRIQRDDDLRRPYWMEAEAAYAFPFEDRVLISDPPETTRILVEGYEYPIRNLDDQDRLVITRDSVEAFADTLRGTPATLPAEPTVNPIPEDTTTVE